MTLLELGLIPERGVTFGIAFRELAQEAVTSQPFQRVQIEPSENERERAWRMSFSCNVNSHFFIPSAGPQRKLSDMDQDASPRLAPSSQSPVPVSNSESSSSGSLNLDVKGKVKQRESRDHPPVKKIEVPADREVQVFGAPTETRDLTACELLSLLLLCFCFVDALLMVC